MSTRIKRARLWDHFSFNGRLQVANAQPHYGLVQLNYFRRGKLVSSCDVKRDNLFAAIEAVFNVTITPNGAGK